MDKKFIETAFFFGKIGVDNLLLIILGIEHLALFFVKRGEGQPYRRVWLYLWEGVFFIGYGFFNDIYRFKLLRPFLLNVGANFVFINSFAILLFGLPLFIKITIDIQRILTDRRKTKYVRKKNEENYG